jgi:hypothetical protein
MKSVFYCDWCGKAILRYKSQVKGKKKIFCCRSCMNQFASKESNPKEYQYRDFSKNSKRISEMNRRLNPVRMTLETRKKLRMARLGTGEGKSYEKTFGRHTHRAVAEQKIGRKLRPGEIVHHKDGNKRNNSPDNLEIFRSQKEHAAYHVKETRFFKDC